MYADKTYTLDSSVKLSDDLIKITISSKFNIEDGVFGYFVGETPAVKEIEVTNYENYDAETHSSKFFYNDVLLATLDHDTGKLTFSDHFDFPVVFQGQDNIVVEFKSQGNKVAYFGEFLTYTDNTLMFYDYSNKMVIYSEYNNLDYFPTSNYVVCNAKGAYPIGDSNVALFTDEGITYLMRQVLTVGKTNTNQDIIKYAYSVLEGKPGTMLASPYSITSLANDILFFSTDGVKALAFGDNITSNERYALERSGFINSKLLKHKDLSKAKAITYNNRYYLAVEDVVYVADARYKVSPRDQDMNDTFNYEWWYWDNMPVKEWLIIDGKLHFLTNNGYVAEFVEDREDERILMLSSNGASLGLMSPVNDDTIFYQLDMNYVEWLKDGSIIQQNTENGTNKYIICTNDSTKYNGQFQLKDYITEEYLSSNVYLFGNDVKSVYICDKSNVVSEWYTPIVNMGTSIYSKNLLTSTLTFEPDIEGEVKYGFVTRRRAEPIYKDSNVKPTDGVSFDNLDFTDFSFAVGFACSRTLKTRIRNYNYIQFRIVSDNNKDCALNNFVVTYTIGRKNKGVR
jgi:hypothetical protein